MCSVEHIPGPPPFLKSKIFYLMKFIAFHLLNNKKGEVITEKRLSKGRNLRCRNSNFSVTSVLINRFITSSKGTEILSSCQISLKSVKNFLSYLDHGITDKQNHRQTEPQTESQTHTSKTITLSQTKFGAR